jgi:hypothetical protein
MVINRYDVKPGGSECRKAPKTVINRCSGRIAIQRGLHGNTVPLGERHAAKSICRIKRVRHILT